MQEIMRMCQKYVLHVHNNEPELNDQPTASPHLKLVLFIYMQRSISAHIPLTPKKNQARV